LEGYYREDLKENDLLKPIESKVTKVYFTISLIFLEKVNSVNQYFQKKVSEIFEIKNKLMKVFTGFSNYIFEPFYEIKLAGLLDLISTFDPEKFASQY